MQVDTAFEFRWDVPEGGYRWIETRPLQDNLEPGPVGRYLTSGIPVGVQYGARRYNPLHRSFQGLFRMFAELEPTEEAIQRFASAYGALGGDAECSILLTTDAGETTWGHGEPLAAWVKEINAMRRAVTLWDAVRNGDAKTLRHFIEWRENAVRYTDGRFGEWIVRPDINPDPPPFHYRAGDVFLPALEYVRRVVNRHLERRVSPRLLWERERDRLVMRMVPGSLVGALWLQFAQAIDANADFGRCDACGKWFVFDPATARTNRRYCSDACRFKAYRQRQKEALELHAQGVPIEQIAERLGSEAETVRRWIEKSGTPRPER